MKEYIIVTKNLMGQGCNIKCCYKSDKSEGRSICGKNC